MQISCTGIPEIKKWTFCVFKGSKSKNSQNFEILCFGKKKFRDSVLISLKYSNSMHKYISDQTVDLLCFYGVQNKKIPKFQKSGLRKNKIYGQRVKQLTICKFRRQGYQKSNHGPFVFLKSPKRKIEKFRDSGLPKKKLRDSVLIS